MSATGMYDAVVIGAGLAGLVCARQLARHGLRVLLMDGKAAVASCIPTTGIFVRRTLEDFDLPPECLGRAIRHVNLHSPSRRTLVFESPHDEFRIGRMARIYDHYLQDCLQAGVVWMPSTLYLGSASSGRCSSIFAEQAGQVHRLRTGYLVGADGARSRVARDLKLDQNREWLVGLEDVLRGVPLEGPPRLDCFLDPALAPGYLAWFAHDGEEAHLGVAGYASRFSPPDALERFRRSLEGVIHVPAAARIERRGGWIPVGGVLRRIADERGLLVGDAAGAPSPLTAGGLDPCFRLSHVAADTIARFLSTGNSAALQSYSGERFRARFESRLWMRRLLATVQSPLLLELLFAALRLPMLRLIAQKIFFGRGSFPDLEPLGLPGTYQSDRSPSR
jgi:flavin-dependent dehydrogenase